MAKLRTIITVPLRITIESDTSVNVEKITKFCVKHIRVEPDGFKELPEGEMVGLWAEWEHPEAVEEPIRRSSIIPFEFPPPKKEAP